MKKTDYTKTENLLNEGLLKMSVQELLELADKTGSFKTEESALPSLQARTILLSFMRHDFETLASVEGAKPEEKTGITQKELSDAIEKIQELTPEKWETLKEVRKRLIAYRDELKDKIPHFSDEEIIALERKKHINKRFNVRDKWLPLH
jgi:hypothetical protein